MKNDYNFIPEYNRKNGQVSLKSKAGKGKEQRQLANDFVDAGGHLTVKKNALAMLIPKLGYENLKHTGKGVGKNKNWTATFPSLGYSQTWATKNKNSPPEDIVDQMVKAAAEVAANVSLRLKPPGTNWKAPTFDKQRRFSNMQKTYCVPCFMMRSHIYKKDSDVVGIE